MEEILKRADELGEMLRETEIHAKYQTLTEEMKADQESMRLLNEYLDLFEEMHKKESGGGIIEVGEKEKLAEIQKKVSENRLIVDYIDAKNSYVNILMEIQKAVSGGDLSV